MLSRSAFRQSILVCTILLLLFSCNYSTTMPKEPSFSKDNATVAGELRNIVSSEHINISGSKITTNGSSTSSQLIVEFINYADTKDDQNELSKKVAAQLKQDLKDPNEFDSYKVCFVKKTAMTSVYKSFVIPKAEL